MIHSVREAFNTSFSIEKYQNLLNEIQKDYPNSLDFRIAESPVFVDKLFKNKLIEACESIIDFFVSDTFELQVKNAIPEGQNVPNQNNHSSFLAIDFAVCKDETGELEPQLIELQGFPSLFGLQDYLPKLYRKYFEVPANFLNHNETLDSKSYFEELKKLILGNEVPENVILLEIFPEKQKTRIDFEITAKELGIEAICLTKIFKVGEYLYYEKDSVKIQIKRIYNRLIFDDLQHYPNLQLNWNPTEEVNVSWVGHPNWFFKISKYAMPFLKHRFIPETKFLSDYQGVFPDNLADFVLKPLFSFAGAGVKINVSIEDLNAINDPQNYILQKKVKYESVVKSPDGLIKCEIRMLYIWHENEPRPKHLTNLARLSRGEMIGVRFNKNFDWVGGSTCFMEQ